MDASTYSWFYFVNIHAGSAGGTLGPRKKMPDNTPDSVLDSKHAKAINFEYVPLSQQKN